MSTTITGARTSSLRSTTIVVAAVGATATTLAAATMRAAGVHLAAQGRIPLAAFAQFTSAGAVLGGLLVAGLNRAAPSHGAVSSRSQWRSPHCPAWHRQQPATTWRAKSG
jgi:hypothetical protein